MTADVYAAWLTAGDRLQSYGHWLLLVPVVAAAAFAAWAIRRAVRDASQRIDNILADQPRRETAPGTNQQLLEQCWDICPDLRKEKP